MCTAIQAMSDSKAGLPRSGKAAQRCARRALADVICGQSILTADRSGEKMRIDLANAVDIRDDLGALKTCACKCVAPVTCSQKARIRADFGICLDVCKAFQNLKHQ